MLTQMLENILVAQIEKEAYSSNLYLAMASWAENNGFEGTAQWLYLQAEEEHIHMLKFITYINERGGKAVIPALKQPPIDYIDIHDLFDQVYKHERLISKSINEIVGVCMEEKDYSTSNWIQWFVNEQIEEEKSVKLILDKLKLIGLHSLYLFDKDIVLMRNTASKA
ncbi:MAG: ferritin [Bacteroidetes bacterium]|nr:ferritin [Bacteroidota bacterium]